VDKRREAKDRLRAVLESRPAAAAHRRRVEEAG